MSKKLMACLVVGVGLVIFTMIVGGNEKETKTASNESKQAVENIKVNDTPVPEHKDNKGDKKPEVIEVTREKAQKFVKHYATLKPKDPQAYLEHIKGIASSDLYTKMENSPRRPTAETHKRVVKEITSYPVDDVLPDRKKWNVVVIADVYNADGKKRTEEIWYWVSVAKDKEKWQVTGVRTGK